MSTRLYRQIGLVAAALGAALPVLAAGEARVELGGGLLRRGEAAVGAGAATLAENRAPGGGRLTLFDTRTTVDGASGWSARLAVRAVGGLHVEGSFERSRPLLQTRVSNDREQPTPVTASARFDETSFDGSLRYDLPWLRFARRRASWFVLSGVGRLRRAPAGAPAFQEGTTVHAGAGLRCRLWSARRGLLDGVGVRVEAREQWLGGDLHYQQKRIARPLLRFEAFLAF